MSASIRLTVGALDVEFNADRGITAIYGHSGRLLEAIAGFVRPEAGRILLEDAILFDAAAHVHLPPQRRRCAFIPRTDSLFPRMTPRQNLAFAARRWPRLERHRRVTETIERFQLTDASPSLAWICARALVAEPKLVLIDDPGLDAGLLRQLRENAAAPILLASANLDLCCSADQLLLLDSGRIVQRGVPREVLDQPQSLAVARLVGLSNLFQAKLGALDPGRNRSVLEFEHFTLGGPYVPGHFRGDRVWVAVAAERLVAHPGDLAPQPNCVSLNLVRVVPRASSVLLEFSGGVSVTLSPDAYARQKDNKEWRVEFPAEALRIL